MPRHGPRDSTPVTISFTAADLEHCDQLAKRYGGNRSEVIRQALETFTKDGRDRLLSDLRATIAGLEAENEDLRTHAANTDRSQKRIDEFVQRARRIIDPNSAGFTRGATQATPQPASPKREEPRATCSKCGHSKKAGLVEAGVCSTCSQLEKSKAATPEAAEEMQRRLDAIQAERAARQAPGVPS